MPDGGSSCAASALCWRRAGGRKKGWKGAAEEKETEAQQYELAQSIPLLLWPYSWASLPSAFERDARTCREGSIPRRGLTCSRAWLHLKLLRLVSSPCHSCLYVPARRPLCCLTGWLLLLLLWIRSPGPQQPCRQRLLRRELWPLRQERGPGMPPTLVQRGTPTPARCISLPQPLCVLAVGILSRSEHGQNSHQARSQQSPPFGMRSTPDKSAQCQSSSCLRQYTAHRTRVHAYCKLPSSTQQSIPPARHLSRLIRSQVDLSVNASRFHRLDPLNAVRRVSNNTAAYRSRSNSRGTASSQSNWD